MFIVYFSGCPVRVYRAGSIRWGQVVSWPDGTLYIETWCVGDMREVVKTHPARDPHHLMSQVVIFISSNTGPPVSLLPSYHDLWGDPAEDSWSEEAWTHLLQAVPKTWKSVGLHIHVLPTATLTGLLACLPQPHLTQDGSIEVLYGTASLGEVEKCVYTCQETGVDVHLGHTTILEPEGEKDSLMTRWNTLLEAKDKQGRRMMTVSSRRIKTGEEYVWRDGWIQIKR